MKPTLFVLAAGMGSRYGGLKQLDGLGPNGETIMDYSIYDAIQAGFGKVVFVIRKDFDAEFREKVLSKYESHIPVEVVYQSIDALPEGFTAPEGRTKPWGTNHAILMARGVINEPFAVINADDFYGRESYQVLADFLTANAGKENTYCMVGYRIGNTLSDSGTVTRGVCQVNSNGFLTGVVECSGIERKSSVVQIINERKEISQVDEKTPVSMNMWGFTPDYFEHSYEYMKKFLTEHGAEEKAEFYIPTLVDDLIKRKVATCQVLDTPSKWFGVTYADDRAGVVLKIAELIKNGVYPSKLWK